jgi:hypothetical protein
MPTDPDPAWAEELLRRFEPSLRFTRGEKFLPADAEDYLRECGLWEQTPRHLPVCLVKRGELTPEHLAGSYATSSRAIHYLKFVEPLSLTKLARRQLQKSLSLKRSEDEEFRAGFGRLARVGYLARSIDTLFSLVLLMRGRVPGNTSAAAAKSFEKMRQEGTPIRYYGRVVRQDQWVVLQYWFFYYFNDWRSGFHGANDHEGDWETVSLYLSAQHLEKDAATAQPEWVAYAAHDHAGGDLRRHWDDPELQKDGEHPVVFVGAGSHASYFRPGEYLTELTLSFLGPFMRTADAARAFWRKHLRQGRDDADDDNGFAGILRVPFIDYARGDGLRLGPGQAVEWDRPILINDPPGWMSNYRGLWGLFTGDPFDGEDAPGGAMYNRDGSLRRSWFDPLGWCALDRVLPSDQLPVAVAQQQVDVDQKIDRLHAAIAASRNQLEGLSTARMALRAQPDQSLLAGANETTADGLALTLSGLREELAQIEVVRGSLMNFAEQLRTGYELPLRDHLRRPARPASRAELRSNRFADFWAAASIGIMLIGVVGLLIFSQDYLISALITAVFVVALIESWFRRRFAVFITNVALLLAFVSLLICLYQFLWYAAILLVVAVGVYILWENLRELWT